MSASRIPPAVKLSGYSEETVYYIYIHCKSDSGEPFYVGKGKDRRMHSSQRRNPHWQNVAAKHGFNAHIVADNLDERSAYAVEGQIIELLKPRYRLCNYTDGGKGMSGYRHTDSARRRMTEKRIGRMHSKEAKQKMSNTISSRPDLIEMRRVQFSGDENPAKKDRNRELSSLRMKKSNPMDNPESVRKAMESRKGLVVSMERRLRISSALKGRRRHYSKEHLDRIKAAGIARRKVVKTTCGLEFESTLAASKALGISQGSISNACTGRTKSAGGMFWYFADKPESDVKLSSVSLTSSDAMLSEAGVSLEYVKECQAEEVHGK